MPDVEPGNLVKYSDKQKKTFVDVADMQCMITKYWKSPAQASSFQRAQSQMSISPAIDSKFTVAQKHSFHSVNLYFANRSQEKINKCEPYNNQEFSDEFKDSEFRKTSGNFR